MTTVSIQDGIPTYGPGVPIVPGGSPRWSSEQLTSLSQTFSGEKGSQEQVYAILSPDSDAFNNYTPTLRLGLYSQKTDDGLPKWNTSIRLLTNQKIEHDDGSVTFKETPFVFAGTTYAKPNGDALRLFCQLISNLLKYVVTSDIEEGALSDRINNGVVTLTGAGQPYVGSTVQ